MAFLTDDDINDVLLSVTDAPEPESWKARFSWRRIAGRDAIEVAITPYCFHVVLRADTVVGQIHELTRAVKDAIGK